MSLIHQRCFNHATREAVARCVACEQYYCRECVTEHAHRLICAACLKKIGAASKGHRRNLAWLAQSVPSLAGVLVAWLFFYWLGQSLLAIPSSFHDAQVWTSFLNDQ